MVMFILLVSAQKVHKLKTFDKDQETWVQPEGVEGAIADFVCFHCPLVASAEANPLPLMAQSTPPQCHPR